MCLIPILPTEQMSGCILLKISSSEFTYVLKTDEAFCVFPPPLFALSKQSFEFCKGNS